MSVDGSTTLATFTCNDGYSMVGTAHIQCTAAGIWNSTVPTCGISSVCNNLI